MISVLIRLAQGVELGGGCGRLRMTWTEPKGIERPAGIMGGFAAAALTALSTTGKC